MNESKHEHLRRFESMTLSLDDAKKLMVEEMSPEELTEAMSQLVPLVGEERATDIIANMLDENAKRACLVSAYGLDKFIEAADIVIATQDVDILNQEAMTLVEQQLLKM